MAILNINQFVEREVISCPVCSRCAGSMQEIPISTMDALKVIFRRKKIIKRYRCMDCHNETRTEKQAAASRHNSIT